MFDHLASWARHTKPAKRARPKTSKPLERDIEKAIRHAFRLKLHVTLFKTDAGGAGMRSGLRDGARAYTGLPAGFSDLVGVIPGTGRAIFVEVKAPGNKPTALQLEFLERRRAEGAVAFWADGVDSALQQFEAAVSGVAA